MKKLLIIPALFLLQTILFAQDSIYSIPLKTKWAADFEFITNDQDRACLLLIQNDKYNITLLDSNYKVVTDLNGMFRTATTPRFIGSIVKDKQFECFFRRVEDDVLLVLIVDAENETLTRIKDFKITELRGEKIIYTGSNFTGNKMTTISYTNNSLIFKRHLPGLKTDNTSIDFKKDDIEFIRDSDCSQLEGDADSMIMVFRKMKNYGQSQSPHYRLFNIDLRTEQYSSIDFDCEVNSYR